MNRISLTTLLALATIGAGCSSIERSRNLANPSVPAQTLALQVCSNCHGVDGNSVSPNFPMLAGQQEEYFVNQLQSFKSHRRTDPEGVKYMWGISRSLSDDQIKALAVHFSAQKPVSPGGGNVQLAAEGKQIFERGLPSQNVQSCTTCHGANGEGKGRIPRIAHQHADYVIKQLTVFQQTNQRPDAVEMKVITHPLSNQQMEAVAAYVQGLPRTGAMTSLGDNLEISTSSARGGSL